MAEKINYVKMKCAKIVVKYDAFEIERNIIRAFFEGGSTRKQGLVRMRCKFYPYS